MNRKQTNREKERDARATQLVEPEYCVPGKMKKGDPIAYGAKLIVPPSRRRSR